MADDLKQTGPQDDVRINVEQEHELGYWSEKFGVSREELRNACAPGLRIVVTGRSYIMRSWRLAKRHSQGGVGLGSSKIETSAGAGRRNPRYRALSPDP
jgi:hypothetical protein